MRIALIAPPWISVPPASYGGTEGVVDTLARGLSSAGHEIVLATTGDSTCPVDRVWTYEHEMVDRLGDSEVELRHVLHAYDAIGSVDIVHDHTIAGPVLAAQRAERFVVTTNHGLFSDDMTAVYRAISPQIPIVAISHHQASTARGIPIARVIHHGLDIARYPVGQGRGGYLAFLGRMSPTKGILDAIQIARRVQMPLVIAAKMRERCEREYFDSAIAPLLGGDVRYVGAVGGADKLRLLGEATALVNPIRWDEPFGLCMIESLACGTPVLVTPRGAAPEIVEDGVTGFIRTDAAELADALADITTLDRKACRAAVERRFSARRMVADHLAFYEQVAQRRRSRNAA